ALASTRPPDRRRARGSRLRPGTAGSSPSSSHTLLPQKRAEYKRARHVPRRRRRHGDKKKNAPSLGRPEAFKARGRGRSTLSRRRWLGVLGVTLYVAGAAPPGRRIFRIAASG